MYDEDLMDRMWEYAQDEYAMPVCECGSEDIARNPAERDVGIMWPWLECNECGAEVEDPN